MTMSRTRPVRLGQSLHTPIAANKTSAGDSSVKKRGPQQCPPHHMENRDNTMR